MPIENKLESKPNALANIPSGLVYERIVSRLFLNFLNIQYRFSYSPDGNGNPTLFCVDWNVQQEMPLLIKPIDLLRKFC